MINDKWNPWYLPFVHFEIIKNVHIKKMLYKELIYFLLMPLLSSYSPISFRLQIRKCFVFIADIDTHVWMCNLYDYRESWSSECFTKSRIWHWSRWIWRNFCNESGLGYKHIVKVLLTCLIYDSCLSNNFL